MKSMHARVIRAWSMMPSSVLAADTLLRKYSASPCVSCPFSSTVAVKPTTAFSGVRSSVVAWQASASVRAC